MPYKTDGSDVPETIAGLSATKRRQFAAVWNSAFEACVGDDAGDEERAECESSAYAQASGVVLKQEEAAMQDKETDIEPLESEAEAANPTLDADGEDAVIATEEAPTVNPTPTADANATDGGGVVGAEEPAVEMDSFAQIRDHLRAALEMLVDMMPSDEDPMPDEEPMEAAETFAESSVPLIRMIENAAPANRRLPLEMDIGIIKVGPGNSRDNHFYTRELLERDGQVFKGLTMHTVDHREDLRNEGTDVSTITEVFGVRKIDDAEYLVGRVLAYDPSFCEKTRNRAEAGLLGNLQCSILAGGKAQPGMIGENKYNIVQEITEGRFVDWVTKAGAGGHALQLAEMAAEPEPATEPEVEPVALDETEAHIVTLAEDNATEGVIQPLPLAEVITELGKTNLPAASVAGLASGQYVDLSEVGAAVTAEVTRLKAAGSGQPLGMAAAPRLPEVKSLQEIQVELSKVNRKWTGGI